MSASAKSIDEAMALLKADCDRTVWEQILESSNLWSSLHMMWPIKKPKLLVNDVVLKPETSVKVLGITIDSRLNF